MIKKITLHVELKDGIEEGYNYFSINENGSMQVTDKELKADMERGFWDADWGTSTKYYKPEVIGWEHSQVSLEMSKPSWLTEELIESLLEKNFIFLSCDLSGTWRVHDEKPSASLPGNNWLGTAGDYEIIHKDYKVNNCWKSSLLDLRTPVINDVTEQCMDENECKVGKSISHGFTVDSGYQSSTCNKPIPFWLSKEYIETLQSKGLRFVTVDEDGIWWAYELKPIIDERLGCWKNTGNNYIKVHDDLVPYAYWENSLIDLENMGEVEK